MQWLDRIVNAVGRRRASSRRDGPRSGLPRPGILTGPHAGSLWRDYPADGLTPKKLMAIFREADAGSLTAQLTLAEQMEERDGHLFSVANTRRLAVTGLPWKIVSAFEMPGHCEGRAHERKLADAAAAYCERVLRELVGFEETLKHLALAFGRNLAVAELVWQAGSGGVELCEIVPVDFGRLCLGDAGDLRILTRDSRFEGIAPPPDKFILYTPHGRSGHPMAGGLLRVTAVAYLAKHFAIKDWLIFAEVFGMPVRIARYQPNATPQEKRELLDMLRQLGADATGIFSRAVDVEIKQTRTPGETNLYESLCLYFDRELSKAWLGQTLTTDTIRTRASAGAAVVHDRVRRDLRDDDLRCEAHAIRRDLLTPMTRLRFGNAARVPHFRRIPEQALQPDQLSRLLATAVNDLGLRVPSRWAHAALGIPEGDGDSRFLKGRETVSKPE